MANLFFMTHASKDHSPEVDRFYSDLRAKVKMLTGCPDKDAGFIDTKELKTGNQWDHSLAAALNESRTIVLLVSAHCIQSEGCGKELRVFLERLRKHRYTSQDSPAGWSPIFPVLWSPLPASKWPDVLEPFQRHDADLPLVLKNEGLFYMMQKGKHDDDYVDVVHMLAKRICDASGTPLAPLDGNLVWNEIPNAFDPSTPPVQIGGSSLPPTSWTPEEASPLYEGQEKRASWNNWSHTSSYPNVRGHEGGHGAQGSTWPSKEVSPSPATFPHPVPSQTKRRGWVLAAAGVIAAVFCVITGLVALFRHKEDVSQGPSSAPMTGRTIPTVTEGESVLERRPAPAIPVPVSGVSITPMAQTSVPIPTQGPERSSWEQPSLAHIFLDMDAPSNFPSARGRSGFLPDPWVLQLTAGGGQNPVDVSSLSVLNAPDGLPCGRSYVTRNPDFHLEFAPGVYPLLRFYVVTDDNSDATLLINAPDTRWHCNDDHHREAWTRPLMPTIDFRRPRAGRYDVWVGTYDGTGRHPARLFVTELESNHP